MIGASQPLPRLPRQTIARSGKRWWWSWGLLLVILVAYVQIGFFVGVLCIMGMVTYGLYSNVPLAIVMSAAMLLNLLVTSMAGYWAPNIIVRMGHDPAFGAHVLLTFITDSMGFFIFLGLATVFLL